MTARPPGLPPPNNLARRRPWPTPVLVVFWLAVIVVAATGAGLAVDHATSRRRVAQGTPPAAVAAEASITPAVPARTTRQANRAAGVVLVRKTPAAELPQATGTPATPEASLPGEVLLQEVPSGKQTRALNCEFQTASDLAWYYGRPFTWEEIYQYVGHDVGGNPHKGFVGRSFDDQPGQVFPLGYGVYAEPIAAAFAELGLSAEVNYDKPRDWVMAQLSEGRPVMVWTTSGMTVRPVATWTAADGVTVKGVPGEHTYLAVGYDADGVWLVDPWDGRRHHFDWSAFLASWDLLDRMALVVTDEPAAAPSAEPAG